MSDTKIKERPILFSGPMILALLAGRKTQTRRIVPLPEGVEFDGFAPNGDVRASTSTEPTGTRLIRNRYGAPGDRMWVKETWAPADYLNGSEREEPQQIAYRATSTILDHGHRNPGRYPLDTYGIDFDKIRWRPSIFMPRWASRITLEVTGVRVERLQEINEEDARAEGLDGSGPVGYIPAKVKMGYCRYDYASLWDEINGKRASWSSNPWVWVVSFKAVRS